MSCTPYSGFNIITSSNKERRAQLAVGHADKLSNTSFPVSYGMVFLTATIRVRATNV